MSKEELNKVLREYVYQNKALGVEEVLNEGADPNIMITMRKKSKMSYYYKGKMTRYRKKRVERGTNYLIHKAVLLDNFKMVESLIKYGAKKTINYNSKKYGTAINCCVKYGKKTSNTYKILEL